MICEKCKCEHDGNFGTGRFCSRSCANSRGPRTKEFKKKVSNKLKGNIPWNKDKIIAQVEKRTCPTCNSVFEAKQSSKRIFCKGKCNPNWGGYREGSGRAKTGYYKGIYCGSTYELAWVIYQIDNNLPFNRFEGFIEGNGIKYIPDFIVNNRIIEIKGYESEESVKRKTELAKSKGYAVSVLRKEDLQTEFDWVESNYSFKNLFELYDDYKPKYNYVCNFCGKEFSRESKSKTDVVFCSSHCSGKYRANIKHGTMV
jgi:DNA-directed RNA polymerase subunit RPC12/RpoP